MTDRMRRHARPGLLVILLVLPLAGCLFSREIANTRRDIEKTYPDLQLERQIVLNLGPVSLKMLGWMAGLTHEPEAEMAARYLKDVRRVKVGVFRSEHPDAFGEIGSKGLAFEKGWEVAVKIRQDDGHVWVLYKDEPETVRDLYVVVLSDEDLVIARVRGNLNRLLARVMEDHVEIGDWIGENL